MDRQIVEETVGRARELTSDKWTREGWDNYDPLSDSPPPAVPGLIPEEETPSNSVDWLEEMQ